MSLATFLKAIAVGAFVAWLAWAATDNYSRWRDCQDRGGEFVQGALGYRCVSEGPP